MTSTILQKTINRLIEGKDLSRDESKKVMHIIMKGAASDAQISAFLVALRIKGETVDEIAGAVDAMHTGITRINSKYKNIVDTCGTGGDSLNTFNISTAAALVTAGAGIAVAKHGNLPVSSKCGSADILKALGVNIEIPPEALEKCLYEVGIAFLFAPRLHTSMKYAMGPRREIGARTIFNVLGPLTNPARTKRQLIGVYEKSLVRLVVEVMQALGAEQVMAVHGFEGLDEISVCGPTNVCELINENIYEYVVRPENFEMKSASVQSIQTDTLAEKKKTLLNVLKGKTSPALDVVLLNAGAAIKVSGMVESLWEGIKAARESVLSGAALEKLEQLKKFTRGVHGKK